MKTVAEMWGTQKPPKVKTSKKTVADMWSAPSIPTAKPSRVTEIGKKLITARPGAPYFDVETRRLFPRQLGLLAPTVPIGRDFKAIPQTIIGLAKTLGVGLKTPERASRVAGMQAVSKLTGKRLWSQPKIDDPMPYRMKAEQIERHLKERKLPPRVLRAETKQLRNIKGRLKEYDKYTKGVEALTFEERRAYNRGAELEARRTRNADIIKVAMLVTYLGQGAFSVMKSVPANLKWNRSLNKALKEMEALSKRKPYVPTKPLSPEVARSMNRAIKSYDLEMKRLDKINYKETMLALRKQVGITRAEAAKLGRKPVRPVKIVKPHIPVPTWEMREGVPRFDEIKPATIVSRAIRVQPRAFPSLPDPSQVTKYNAEVEKLASQIVKLTRTGKTMADAVKITSELSRAEAVAPMIPAIPAKGPELIPAMVREKPPAKVLEYITKRKKEIRRMLEIDKKIGADPYDDVARLKEIEKIEKIWIAKEKAPPKTELITGKKVRLIPLSPEEGSKVARMREMPFVSAPVEDADLAFRPMPVPMYVRKVPSKEYATAPGHLYWFKRDLPRHKPPRYKILTPTERLERKFEDFKAMAVTGAPSEVREAFARYAGISQAKIPLALRGKIDKFAREGYRPALLEVERGREYPEVIAEKPPKEIPIKHQKTLDKIVELRSELTGLEAKLKTSREATIKAAKDADLKAKGDDFDAVISEVITKTPQDIKDRIDFEETGISEEWYEQAPPKLSKALQEANIFIQDQFRVDEVRQSITTKLKALPQSLKPSVLKPTPIPKELEPLAREARKYKSAEEFEKNVYVHYSPDKNIKEIKGGSIARLDKTEKYFERFAREKGSLYIVKKEDIPQTYFKVEEMEWENEIEKQNYLYRLHKQGILDVGAIPIRVSAELPIQTNLRTIYQQAIKKPAVIKEPRTADEWLEVAKRHPGFIPEKTYTAGEVMRMGREVLKEKPILPVKPKVSKELGTAVWTKEDEAYPVNKIMVYGIDYDQARLRDVIRKQVEKLPEGEKRKLSQFMGSKYGERRPLATGYLGYGKKPKINYAEYLDDIVIDAGFAKPLKNLVDLVILKKPVPKVKGKLKVAIEPKEEVPVKEEIEEKIIPIETIKKKVAKRQPIEQEAISPSTAEVGKLTEEEYRTFILVKLRALGDMVPDIGNIITQKQRAFAYLLANKKKLTIRQLHRLENIITRYAGVTMKIYTKTGRLKKRQMNKQQASQLIRALQNFFVRPYKKPRIPRGREVVAKDIRIFAQSLQEGLRTKAMSRREVAHLVRSLRTLVPPPQQPKTTVEWLEYLRDLPNVGASRLILPQRYWFEKWGRITGIPIYEKVYLGFETAKRKAKVFSFRWQREINKAFGDLIEDNSARRKIYYYLTNPAGEEPGSEEGKALAKEMGLTDAEHAVCKKLRPVYRMLGGIFKIQRFWTGYQPRIRKAGGIRFMYPKGRIPRELKFFAELERVGFLSPHEDDSLKVAYSYLRAGANKLYIQPVLDATRNIRNARWMPSLVKVGIDNYIRQKLGWTTEGDQLVSATVQNIARGMGFGVDPDLGRRIMQLYFISSYGGALGFRVMPVVRNSAQPWILTLPELGSRWFAAGLKRAWARGGIAEAREAGFLLAWGVPYLERIEQTLGFGKLIDIYVKFARLGLIPYARIIDASNRAITYHGNKARFEHYWKAYQVGKISKEKFERGIDLAGYDATIQGVVRNSLYVEKKSEESLDLMTMDLIDSTQWPYRPGTEMGVGFGKGRLLTQFLVWPTEFASTLVKRWLLRKQFKKIWRFLFVCCLIYKGGRKVGVNVKKWILLGPIRVPISPFTQAMANTVKLAQAAMWKNKDGVRRYAGEIARSMPVTVAGGLAGKDVLKFRQAYRNNWKVYDAKKKLYYQSDPVKCLLDLFGFDPVYEAELREEIREDRDITSLYKRRRAKIIDEYLAGNKKRARTLEEKWGIKIYLSTLIRARKARAIPRKERVKKLVPKEYRRRRKEKRPARGERSVAEMWGH